jgi:hypothetical protein
MAGTPEYKVKRKTALESPETFAVVLYSLLNEQYEDQWLYWDPATIYLELKDDFDADPASEVMDRIACLQVIMTTGEFFNNTQAFLAVCNTLLSGAPAFSVFDPVNVAEASWAVAEVAFLREFLPFNYGITKYLKTILDSEGYTDDYPDIFDEVFAKKMHKADEVRDEAVKSLRDKDRDEIAKFIHEQLQDMVYQFHELGMTRQLESILKQKDRELLT